MQVVTHEELGQVLEQIGDTIRNALTDRVEAAPTYMNRAQAARYLCMGLSKLDDLTRQGHIRRAKIGEGERAQVLYRRMDLDAFVEAHLEHN